MTNFRFVPEWVSALVETVCKEHDLTCLDIRKEGVYSGYFATITDGTDTVEHFMPYDYALTLPADERAGYLADQLAQKLPNMLNKEAAPEPAAEPDPADDTAVVEDAPKKPRKRAKAE